jgi:hypothetical protein
MANREQSVESVAPAVGNNTEKFLQMALAALVGLTVVIAGFAIGRGYSDIITSHDLTGSAGDYGGYMAIARVNAQGGLIYRDAWTSKPPLMFFYITPFVQLFGTTVTAFNVALFVLTLAFVVVMTLLAYRLTRSMVATAGVMLLALVYAVWQDGPETTFLMSTLGTGAILVAISARGRLLGLILAGALFGLGVFAKQPLAIELPALLAFGVWGLQQTPPLNPLPVNGEGTYTRSSPTNVGTSHDSSAAANSQLPRKKFLSPKWLRVPFFVLVGCAIGGSIILLWAISNGVFDLMWDRAFSQNIRYVAGSNGEWHFHSGFIDFVRRYFVPNTLPYLLPLLALSIPAAILLLRQRPIRGLTWIVLAWLALTFGGALAGRALKPDYFTQMLPPLLMLTGLGIAAALRLKIGWQVALASLALVVIAQFIIATLPANHQRKSKSMTREWATVEAINAAPDGCVWQWGAIGFISYMADRDLCASPVNEGFLMDAQAFPITHNRVEYMQEIIFSHPTTLVIRSDWGFFDELERFEARYVGDLLFHDPAYDVYAVDTSAQHEIDAHFADEIALIGYDLPPQAEAYCPGDMLELALTWQVLHRPASQYQFFAQVLTEDETARIAGFDGLPHDDMATNEWVNHGEVLLGDDFTLSIPPETEAGVYHLIVGLYEVESLARQPVFDAAGQPVGTYARLQEIVVSDDCE